MSSDIEVGDVIQLQTYQQASESANYDAWSNHNGSRINIKGKLPENEEAAVRIVNYEGGSYYARSMHY